MFEGQTWKSIQNDLATNPIILKRDINTIENNVYRLNNIIFELKEEEILLKEKENESCNKELLILYNKLYSYSNDKNNPDKHSKTHDHRLKMSIKLNKTQKDAMVAKSLQLNKTMQKVLGSISTNKS